MKLYLIPTPIGQGGDLETPQENIRIISTLNYFFVENIRTARRYISSLKIGMDIDSITFIELSEHTPTEEIAAMLDPVIERQKLGAMNINCGLLSEAGLPCVADPGSLLVELAHQKKIEVVPLVGSSSLMLALMASGANGQSFAFAGYLPIKENERVRSLKMLETRAAKERQTQIFIETPYRNISMFQTVLSACSPNLMLSLSTNLMTDNQRITTHSIAQWQKMPTPPINKIPAIFILFSL